MQILVEQAPCARQLATVRSFLRSDPIRDRRAEFKTNSWASVPFLALYRESYEFAAAQISFTNLSEALAGVRWEALVSLLLQIVFIDGSSPLLPVLGVPVTKRWYYSHTCNSRIHHLLIGSCSPFVELLKSTNLEENTHFLKQVWIRSLP